MCRSPLSLAPNHAVALRRHDWLEVLLKALGVDVGPRRRIGALLCISGHEPCTDLLEHVVHDVRKVAAAILREPRRVRQLPAEVPERVVEILDLPVSGRVGGVSVAQLSDLPERAFEQCPGGRHVTREDPRCDVEARCVLLPPRRALAVNGAIALLTERGLQGLVHGERRLEGH